MQTTLDTRTAPRRGLTSRPAANRLYDKLMAEKQAPLKKTKLFASGKTAKHKSEGLTRRMAAAAKAKKTTKKRGLFNSRKGA